MARKRFSFIWYCGITSPLWMERSGNTIPNWLFWDSVMETLKKTRMRKYCAPRTPNFLPNYSKQTTPGRVFYLFLSRIFTAWRFHTASPLCGRNWGSPEAGERNGMVGNATRCRGPVLVSTFFTIFKDPPMTHMLNHWKIWISCVWLEYCICCIGKKV